MTTLHGDSHPEVRIWEFPLANFLVLARPDLPTLFILNPTASLIWQWTKECNSVHEVAARLAEYFSIGFERAVHDVGQLLASWSETLFFSPETRKEPRELASFVRSSDEYEGYFRLERAVIRLSLDSKELRDEILPRLEHLRTTSAGCRPHSFHLRTDGSGIAIYHEDQMLGKEENTAAARAFLLPEMLRVAQGEGEWLALLHAGACGFESRAIIFPAASHSGKTTLAAALMHSGGRFLSDDSVALTDSFGIPAMPFALAIREGSWRVLANRLPNLNKIDAFSRFGQQVRFLPPTPVGECSQIAVEAVALVFTRYVIDVEDARVEAIDTLEALVRLRESGFWVAHNRTSIADFLNWIEKLRAYTMTYSDLDQAVVKIREIAARSSATTEADSITTAASATS